ncbi:Hsp90 cochaperone [Malassezia yamatoensis]|uniref:Hsp90 cochaperone n=1 Tax=Malassezia yamatoensis TaxID=253288 RepID=A0AAJ5YYE0_9BASI|nr:Hsp90 cochaperone [Malassezia yamatoensis]
MSVAELKAQGNASFAQKDYEAAIAHYTNAIAAAEQTGEKDGVHVLYSNRSASHAGLKHWDEALKDAEKTIEANPSFAKGYGRKGGALHGAHRFDEAIQAYKTGLEKNPDDAALKRGLEDVERAQNIGNPADSMGKMFQDPNMFQKLSQNPKTAPLLADAAFVQKLKDLQKGTSNPMMMMQDPRMIQVMGVMMGIDLQAFERPEDVPGAKEQPPTPTPSQPAQQSTTQTSSSSSSNSKPQPAAETPEESMPEADSEEAKNKAAAEAEKKLGNERYLKRDFESAAEHYRKAWDLHHDITFLNNLGAVYYEQGQYDECIKTCEKAVEEGRALRADYKLVAKAFGRIGSAYVKQDNLDQAIEYFQRSLTEHRTAEVLNKMREAEKQQKERARVAYLDPAKSEEERNRGNALYKDGDFPQSVQAYTEAIKRNPSDPRNYTNRASAYTKLAALPEALKDTNEAIQVDPKFVKAYIRKSNVLFAMKEYTKALEAIQIAADVDKEQSNTNQREIQAQNSKCMNALYSQRSTETEEQTLERAMRDPEVAQIMQDPVMQSILQQAQSDPAALQDHMKNPSIRTKIQKLIAAGIIRTR